MDCLDGTKVRRKKDFWLYTFVTPDPWTALGTGLFRGPPGRSRSFRSVGDTQAAQ